MMVIVRLWGGLGNQMFQYACGYAIAKRNHQQLVLDTRFFSEKYLDQNPHFSKQQLNLFRFPLDSKMVTDIADRSMLLRFLQNRTVSRAIRVPGRFRCGLGDGLEYVKETRLRFLPYVRNLKVEDVYLDGYWQCERYFDDVFEDLRRQFRLNSGVAQEYSEKMSLTRSNTVAIHLRMGDYTAKKRILGHYNYVIEPQYYRNAITYIREHVENPVFYICSNNIQKAKALLGVLPEYVYVNEQRVMTDMDEFEIMTRCTHHIISNSTFSWWTAWLTESGGGLVLAPDVFFGNKEIIPDSYIKIKVD